MDFPALVVFVSLVITAVVCNDLASPGGCSRVEWEDTMLQKMVRTEITTKEYMEKLERALDVLKVQTGIFEETKKNLEQTVEDAKANLAQTIREVRSEVEQINEEISKVTTDRLNRMERMVLDFEGRLITPTVVFSVRDVLQTSSAEYTIVRFEHVILNEGGAFDDVTGIFTAPINGTYLFGAQVCSSSSKHGNIEVVVGSRDNPILHISDYEASTSYTSTSGTAVVYLSKGQRVWVQNRYSTAVYYDRVSWCWNQFTGVLIHI